MGSGLEAGSGLDTGSVGLWVREGKPKEAPKYTNNMCETSSVENGFEDVDKC